MLDQPRSTQWQEVLLSEEERLRERIVDLACAYGRYGYRRITGLQRNEGWHVNHKRVERLWRLEGLNVPQQKMRRRHLWLNDGSCIRLRPERKDHVWGYDFPANRTGDGKPLKSLAIVDDYTRECLSNHAARQITAVEVIEQLADLFLVRGIPDHLRSDNGSKFTAKIIPNWLSRLGMKTLYVEPGSPWENGYIESFNGKLKDELLNGEIFDTISEARVITETWRKHYNRIKPHSSLGYRAPATEAHYPR